MIDEEVYGPVAPKGWKPQKNYLAIEDTETGKFFSNDPYNRWQSNPKRFKSVFTLDHGIENARIMYTPYVPLSAIERKQKSLENPYFVYIYYGDMGNAPLLDFPPSCRVVRYHKPLDSKGVYEPYEYDLFDQIKKVDKNREILNNFGPVFVKSLEKRTERNQEYLKFGILFFPKDDKSVYFWRKSDSRSIVDMIKHHGMGRKNIIRTTVNWTTLLCVENLDIVMHIRLAYAGNFNIKIIDLDEMKFL
jgi:hypothetical protein